MNEILETFKNQANAVKTNENGENFKKIITKQYRAEEGTFSVISNVYV